MELAAGKLRFHALDAIRGLAALLVVLRHTGPYFGPMRFQESYLAVDVFFVLSGVVIAYSYEHKLRVGLSLARFSWLRLVRIYPLYLLGTSIGVLAVLCGPHGTGEYRNLALLLGLALVLAPNLAGWGDHRLYPLDHPSWSLCLELSVNVAYAACVRFLHGTRLWWLLVSLATALAAVALVHGSLDAGFSLRSLPGGAARCGFSFLAGALLYRTFAARSAGGLGPWPAPVRAGTLWCLVALVPVLLMSSPPPQLRPFVDFFAVVVVFPAAIYGAMWLRPGARCARLCDYLGGISYAVYVLHQPISVLANEVLADAAGLSVARYAPVSGLLFLLLLAATCWEVDRRVDAPVRRWLLGKANRVWRPGGVT